MIAASSPQTLKSSLKAGDLLAFVLIGLALAGGSMYLGGDGTPDFRIYHFYNGFAAASGGRPGDIAAAQMQTYFFPGMDVLYYWLTTSLNDSPRTLRAILAVPYIISTCIIYLLVRAALPSPWPARRTMSLLAAGFGIAGSASLPTLGTSMSDIVPGTFVLMAVYAYLQLQARKRNDAAALWAGIGCGIAVGLKLTAAPLFIGFMLATTLSRLLVGDRWLRSMMLFGLSGGFAVLAVCGAWWWHLYAQFGNPLFPAFNDIFKSDSVAWGRWSDDRFKPRGLMMALFYPFFWAFAPSGLAIELPTRDARMALAFLCVLATALLGFRRAAKSWRTRKQTIDCSELFFYVCLPIFALLAFVLWERLLSIYRYLAVLEALSGLFLVLALAPASAALGRKGLNAAALLIMACVSYSTIYPWWSRSAPASQAVHLGELPKLAPASSVVFLDAYAMSYLAPFFPPDTRFIGANNNLVHPGDSGLLQKEVEASIRSASGEIWGLEFPPAFPGMADATLAYYGLQRVLPCTPIRSNIEDGALLMCKLRRATS